jgi:hypothetical protein
MKILKYVSIGIGALVLLVGAVLAYVAATFNPNDYKPQIIQLVKEKKNRTLKLDGDIKLSFWPNVGAELGKVSLSEAKSEKEFAAVGQRPRVGQGDAALLEADGGGRGEGQGRPGGDRAVQGRQAQHRRPPRQGRQGAEAGRRVRHRRSRDQGFRIQLS